MRVHVVSDAHGRTDALAAAADGADAFFCLGDLLLFVDYTDHRQGIFPDLFGAEAARQYIELREVDVLCAHIPPAVPELLFDTVAQRMERGSEALPDAVRRTQPRYVLFSHVHQPLARRLRIGRTECINVGHFRATGIPHVLAW